MSDPGVLAALQMTGPTRAGVEVAEHTALALSAVWRAVALISQSIAQLPLVTYRRLPDGQREPVGGWLDNPGGPGGLRRFSWKELVYVHLLLHGNAFMLHRYGGAGQLIGLTPVHPMSVGGPDVVDVWPDGRPVAGGKIWDVTYLDGSVQRHDESTLCHVMGMTVDGLRGLSPIGVARESLGTAIAGDRAASTVFGSGALMGGIVSPKAGTDLDDDEVIDMNRELAQVSGWDHSGQLVAFHTGLDVSTWSLNLEDAQFLQSRVFQIEEIARWFGVPPHLLMQTDKQTSWGTGVAESNRGMSRTVLAPWAVRLEEAMDGLTGPSRLVEFDFTRWDRPTPEVEATTLAAKVAAGIITRNEARAVLGMAPVAGGDLLTVNGVPLALPAIGGGAGAPAVPEV